MMWVWSALVAAGLLRAAEGAGCYYWITEVGERGGAVGDGIEKYMDCAGVASMADCGTVECTDEGYAASGCVEVSKDAYHCLIAKERPEDYSYLVSDPASCPGLPLPPTPPPPGPSPVMPEVVVPGPPGEKPPEATVDEGDAAVAPSGQTGGETDGSTNEMSGGYGRRRKFRRFRKFRRARN